MTAKDAKRYKPGDRLYYLNSFGQGMYGTIVRHYVNDKGRGFLFVQRDEWPSPECIDLDDYVRSRHWPKGEQEDYACNIPSGVVRMEGGY